MAAVRYVAARLLAARLVAARLLAAKRAAVRRGALLVVACLLGACMDPLAFLGANSAGNLVGDNTGNLAGNNTGSLVGNNTGSLVGNNTGSLVGNNAAAFAGTVAAPASLVANNVAGLISNNAGGLVGNNTGSYRIAGLEQVPAPGALVYLTHPDEKFFSVDGKVISTTTDSSGRYDFGAVLPEGRFVVVNAMLARNKRLVGFVVSRKGQNQVDIDVATTYVMEMFRSEAGRAGKTFADYDLARLPHLAARTAVMLASGKLGLAPDRLVVGNAALLVDDYVAALSADPETLAAWAELLGRRPVAALTLAGTYGFRLNAAEPEPGPQAPAFAATAIAATQGRTYVGLPVMHQIVTIDQEGMLRCLTGRTGTDPFTTAAPPVPADGSVVATTRIPQPIALAADAGGNLFVTMSRAADAPRNVLLLLNADSTPKFGRQSLEPGRIYRIAGAPEDRWDDQGFVGPTGLAVDDAGNVYVADNQNDRIIRVSRDTGALLRVAGIGRDVFWSKVNDGEKRATQSPLLAPVAVAWRRNGADEELFILDSFNQRVRLVRAPGGAWPDATMRTIAGSGAPVTGAGAPVVSAGFGGDGGSALEARFGFARTDTGNWEASEVSYAGMALDAARNVLYVADPLNRRVRAIDLAAGTVRTVAGGGKNQRDGLAATADLVSPAGLAVWPNGDLVVADRGAHAVRRITLGD